MKKRTVITTEKREVWVIRHASEIPAGVAQAPETDSWESESSSESLTALPEGHPDKNKTTVQREAFERLRVLRHQFKTLLHAVYGGNKFSDARPGRLASKNRSARDDAAC